MATVLAAILSIPVYIGIPAIVLYFVIKKAVKKAIKELKEEEIL